MREEGGERQREGRVCKCISQYESNSPSLVISLLYMTVNHLRYDLYMAGFFLHANGSIKDRIHHVKYHNGTNIFSVHTECVNS